MASKYGVSQFTKAFRLLLKQAATFNKDTVKLVGQDHLGNKYFEAKRPNHSRPVQRFYDAPKRVQSFDEVIDTIDSVPPAWSAWLRFRRQDPPSDLEVMEGEEYYRMQQDKAASKKNENHASTDESNAPSQYSRAKREIPKGQYPRSIQN